MHWKLKDCRDCKAVEGHCDPTRKYVQYSSPFQEQTDAVDHPRTLGVGGMEQGTFSSS
ncbi:hypothetical protein DOTSEDRAFT_68950 [Dothistroma septosporum NZE10]|uniref:Uncharacterized protein n=1 Tax=Dothistroma septosporum (strain NZE10 / CBS 128990) TaxID=675120 RepID=N1Q583_DOTSN|nr:hypothetical protein DOTSEDRAFT_68950 [Dothistroma septosporum NZE10]